MNTGTTIYHILGTMLGLYLIISTVFSWDSLSIFIDEEDTLTMKLLLVLICTLGILFVVESIAALTYGV